MDVTWDRSYGTCGNPRVFISVSSLTSIVAHKIKRQATLWGYDWEKLEFIHVSRVEFTFSGSVTLILSKLLFINEQYHLYIFNLYSCVYVSG